MIPGDEVACIHDGWIGFGFLTCIKTCETIAGISTLYTVKRAEVDYEVTENEISETYSYRIEQLCLRVRPKEVPAEDVIPSAIEAPKDVPL